MFFAVIVSFQNIEFESSLSSPSVSLILVGKHTTTLQDLVTASGAINTIGFNVVYDPFVYFLPFLKILVLFSRWCLVWSLK